MQRTIAAAVRVPSFHRVRPFSGITSPKPRDGSFTLYLSCLPGLEPVLSKELRTLDIPRTVLTSLFVDDDNAKGRIVEGLFARIVEYNDAMCVLFPESCTIPSRRIVAEMDAEPHEGALAICESLGLCPARSEAWGTALDLSYHLDQYDLIVTMDDNIRSRILRSIVGEKEQQEYAAKCRLLSDFLPEGVLLESTNTNSSSSNDASTILDMLDGELQDRVKVLSPLLREEETKNQLSDILHRYFDDNGLLFQIAVPANKDEFHASRPRLILTPSGAASWNIHQESWPLTEVAMIMATAGITRFCLDTIQNYYDQSFQNLLEINYPILHKNCVDDDDALQWEKVDAQLRRCSHLICGYFSPGERKGRWEAYCRAKSNHDT
mmetsp:Transcript_26563/g.40305  ORF Transcript_26563/g.40305 Transcript_26563/m.40305 type:complete len:379 (-) Transcript_26563:59-1195(-)